MSPDRTTITRAEAVRRRKEEELRQKEKKTNQNVAKPRSFLTKAAPTKPRIGIFGNSKNTPPSVSNNNWRNQNTTSMGTLYGRDRNTTQPKVAIRSFNLPKINYGPRWISFLIAFFCVLDLYFLLNSDPFIIRAAEISGNQRISTQEIENAMGVVNLPAATVNPTQVQANILATFPDVSTITVDVQIPGKVVISLEERIPVAAWIQDGKTLWVDAEGYSFPTRGQINDILNITASGAPPTPAADPDAELGPKPFLPADIFATIKTIQPMLPQGAEVIFRPEYGLGWKDPQGWEVFFGYSNGESDNSLKVEVYKSMLTYLSKKNIKPVLINVEYPNAPFYRVEQ